MRRSKRLENVSADKKANRMSTLIANAAIRNKERNQEVDANNSSTPTTNNNNIIEIDDQSEDSDGSEERESLSSEWEEEENEIDLTINDNNQIPKRRRLTNAGQSDKISADKQGKLVPNASKASKTSTNTETNPGKMIGWSNDTMQMKSLHKNLSHPKDPRLRKEKIPKAQSQPSESQMRRPKRKLDQLEAKDTEQKPQDAKLDAPIPKRKVPLPELAAAKPKQRARRQDTGGAPFVFKGSQNIPSNGHSKSKPLNSSSDTLSSFFSAVLSWDFHDAIRNSVKQQLENADSLNKDVNAANKLAKLDSASDKQKTDGVISDDSEEEGEIESSSTTSPPASPFEQEVSKIPSRFSSYTQYYDAWKPLAIEEVQAQTLNAVFSEAMQEIPVVVKEKDRVNSLSSDFLRPSDTVKIVLLPATTPKAQHLRIEQDPLDSIFTNDLILLTTNARYFSQLFRMQLPNVNNYSTQSSPSNSNKASNDYTPVAILGVVVSQRASREGLMVSVLKSQWLEMEPKQTKLTQTHQKNVHDSSGNLISLSMFKLNNLITSVREFRALIDCREYRLLPLLLSGQHQIGSMQLDSLGIAYVKWLEKTFNDSQLEAITAAATSDGFTLIKGPPGTGKTTTLKGLLNSLHLREYSRYYNAVLDVARRPDHETNQAWAKIGNEKPHILVTAPSNAAVDNIVAKVIEEGFCDGEGRRYFPQIVRVGRGLSQSVKSVGLEEMVSEICSKPVEVLEQHIAQLRHNLRIVESDAVHLRHSLRHVTAKIEFEATQANRAKTNSTDTPIELKVSESDNPLRSKGHSINDEPSAMEVEKLLPDTLHPVSTINQSQVRDELDTSTHLTDNLAFNVDERSKAYSALMSGSDSESGENEEDEAFPYNAKSYENEVMEVEIDEPLPNGPSSQVFDSANTPDASINAEFSEDDMDYPPPPMDDVPKLEAESLQHSSNSSQQSIGQDIPLEPPPPPPESPRTPMSGSHFSPIDYNKYLDYQKVAQQINACLERASELKLELQRYQFAHSMAREPRQNSRVIQDIRQSLEVSFLDTAHIVFTTLSSAGVAALDASSRYDVLVVDEAAQAVELSTIIPMKFGSSQCVLVGDPQQLSATVFSRSSGISLYERSLFERLESCGHPVHMLRTQYRSHPMISAFPRRYFYEGKLQDGPNVQTPQYNKPYHHLGPAFKPLTFWNLLSSREAKDSQFNSARQVSRLNIEEVDLAVNLYLTLKNSCPPDCVAGKVGVITPYSQQMEELRKRFRQTLGPQYINELEINTVDGYQGREKDIIILSTVRADPKSGVGFLNDIRRMNVSLTRAKFACYIIGSESTLKHSKPWKALIDHVREEKCLVHVENPSCNLLLLEPMVRPKKSNAHVDAWPRNHDRLRHGDPRGSSLSREDSHHSTHNSRVGFRGRFAHHQDQSRANRSHRGGRDAANNRQDHTMIQPSNPRDSDESLSNNIHYANNQRHKHYLDIPRSQTNLHDLKSPQRNFNAVNSDLSFGISRSQPTQHSQHLTQDYSHPNHNSRSVQFSGYGEGRIRGQNGQPYKHRGRSRGRGRGGGRNGGRGRGY